MASSNICWGVEIGAGAVKALKLVRDGDSVTVEDFAVIPHARPLSTPDIDPNDAIRVALGALVNQHDLSKANIAISAPGHASFARFAKLPPVEPKKVPDIVKFEAVQQIPYPIEEVEWDYQTFAKDDDPEIECGIFAITRERVMEQLGRLANVGVEARMLTISPLAVYNAIAYDEAFTVETPGTVILDIGTTATDLIIAEAGRVWIRTFPVGGHQFTEALVQSFKLPYAKADKLKREAERSSHKKHLFQAMRPVFSDLTQDIQRSLTYYRQLHPEADLKRLIGVGSTFRLLGLRKYLAQQLGMDIARLDNFNRLGAEGAREADFQAVTLNMATAYGLALQGVGLATIDANLVPLPVIRHAIWKRKTPWFAAAATLAIAAGGVSFYRPFMDARSVEQARSNPELNQINRTVSKGNELQRAWQEVEQETNLGFAAANVMSLLNRRDVYQRILSDVGAMLAAAEPQDELLRGEIEKIPPDQRQMFDLVSLDVDYFTPSGGSSKGPNASAGGKSGRSNSSSNTGATGGRGRSSSQLGGGENRIGGDSRRSEERRREQPAPQEGQPANINGMMRLTLVVKSTNAGRLDFVDNTVLEWVRENAERENWPYSIRPIGIDAIVVVEVGGDRQTGGTNARDGRSGTSSTFGGTARSGNQGSDSAAPAGSLDALAPLTLPEDPNQGAVVYQYTIELDAPLNPPQPALKLNEGQRAMAGEAE